MTPRTEAGRVLLGRTYRTEFGMAEPSEEYGLGRARMIAAILAIEAEQDAATRKELAAKVAALPGRSGSEAWGGWSDGVERAAVLAILSGEPEPKEVAKPNEGVFEAAADWADPKGRLRPVLIKRPTAHSGEPEAGGRCE